MMGLIKSGMLIQNQHIFDNSIIRFEDLRWSSLEGENMSIVDDDPLETHEEAPTSQVIYIYLY